jgi:hypothetical protein
MVLSRWVRYIISALQQFAAVNPVQSVGANFIVQVQVRFVYLDFKKVNLVCVLNVFLLVCHLLANLGQRHARV